MLDRELILTPTGMRRLRRELDNLVTVGRSTVADDIREARQHGPSDESPEYSDAKTAQAFVEYRIARLKELLATARQLTPGELCNDVSGLGMRVQVKELAGGEVWEFLLVSSAEADPEHDQISVDCPFGQAMLGRHTGELVEVTAPEGSMQYQILAVRPLPLED